MLYNQTPSIFFQIFVRIMVEKKFEQMVQCSFEEVLLICSVEDSFSLLVRLGLCWVCTAAWALLRLWRVAAALSCSVQAPLAAWSMDCSALASGVVEHRLSCYGSVIFPDQG